MGNKSSESLAVPKSRGKGKKPGSTNQAKALLYPKAAGRAKSQGVQIERKPCCTQESREGQKAWEYKSSESFAVPKSYKKGEISWRMLRLTHCLYKVLVQKNLLHEIVVPKPPQIVVMVIPFHQIGLVGNALLVHDFAVIEC